MTVVLHFTLPQQAADGTALNGPRRVEIFREFASTPQRNSTQTGKRAPHSRATYRLDSTALSKVLVGNTVTFQDALTPKQFQEHRGQLVRYRVRTAVGKGGWSPLSKMTSVTLVVPPKPVRDLTAKPAPGSVTLHWSLPAPGASPMPGSFAVYRTPLESAGSAAGPAEAVTVTTGTSYQDSSVEANRSYRYTVRGIAPAPGGEVESADSPPVVVKVPASAVPASPEHVAAIPVRLPTGSLEVDLSWAISGARDLAGYNVYRSERPGKRGARLNRQVLASTAFRDTTVAAGHVYYYSVASVDLAGRESAPSAPVAVKVPKPGPGSS